MDTIARPTTLFDLSPMLREIIIRNVLEKDPESYDLHQELTKEETDKVSGFMRYLELQHKNAGREVRRKRVKGQFTHSLKETLRKK